ncbi:MAG: hypothetical protein KJZ65_14805 [Phycisphaerales bacterium]|nr:hypothetical protein [Phycisphaerales bacterium]
MPKRWTAVAASAVAIVAGSAAAGPLFTYLSSERYVEGWANGPFMQPPQYDYQRLDATGFLPETLDLFVFVQDDLGQRVSTRVTQDSWIHSQGFIVSGRATGDLGPPAGSSEAYSHSRFVLQFQVSRDMLVPLFLHVTDNEEPYAEFHFTGPGVDMHYLPYDQPQIFFEGMIALAASQTYTIALDVRGESWMESHALYELQFWVPAPSTAAVMVMTPVLCARRRR